MTQQELCQDDLVRLSNAFVFAMQAHAETYRGDGVPYVSHPFRVALHALSLGMSVDAVISSVLHDVVEDTDITLEEIEERFGSPVRLMVQALTKPEKGTPNRSGIYHSQLLNGPEDARRIKLLDIQDNLSDVDEFMGKERAAEYRKDRETLAEALKASLR